MYPKILSADTPLCAAHTEIQNFVHGFIAKLQPSIFGYASPTINYVIHTGHNEIAIQDQQEPEINHMDIARKVWAGADPKDILGGIFQLQYRKEHNTQIFKIILMDPHETFFDVHSKTIEILQPLRSRMPFPKNSKVLIVRG